MNKKIRTLFGNSFLLILVQLLNFLVPLLLLPYLTRTLAVKEFGAVMAVMAVSTVAYVVTDYGFNLSATYKISRKRENKKYIDDLISVIFSAKIVLVALAIMGMCFIGALPAYRDYNFLIFCGAGAVIFQAFQPIWLFQGLEKMKIFSVCFIATKFLHVALVYAMVRNAGDGYLVLISWSIANFVGCVAALFLLVKNNNKIRFSGPRKALHELKKGKSFFLSRFAAVLYTSASTFILGNFSLYQAALYSTAEQGYKAGQAITSAVGQALYPFMAKEKDWNIFKKVVLAVLIATFSISIFIFFLSDYFVYLFFGDGYIQSVPALKIMLVTLMINSMAVLFGYPALAAIYKLKWANRTTMIGVIIFLFLLALNTLFMEITALSFAVMILLTELSVLMLRVYPVIRK